MKQLSVFLFTIVLAATAAAAEMRTWTDNQGRTVEAEMTGFKDGRVIMKLANGKELAFPFQLLSEEDRGYVRENAPIDPKTAARQIDVMVFEKLKAENAKLKEQQKALATNTSLTRADKLKKLEDLQFREKMTHPTPKTSDEQFVRRVYLDIAGRIPTYEEAQRFLLSSSRNKRSELIDELLDSEAFVSHFFNYMSDLLRVREGISMGGFENLKSGAYVDWIKDQIRQDTPWDEFVREMITAEGYYWENPATGYLLTDYGMELCNLSNTFTVFTGTEITCAQCHDHPFEEVYQMDFYKMAAFFGKLEYEMPPDPELPKQLDAKRKELSAAAKKQEKNLNGVEDLLSAYKMSLGDGGQNKVELPHDYQYDDGEPFQKIEPAAYFGEIVNLENYENPREAFAAWMTSEKNPRFTINIANRLWKHVFGYGQIEPVYNIPGHLDGQAQNYELLKFLEQLMKELNYSVKDFLRVLYKTETYQREACYHSPTLAMIDKGEYHFPAPVLRRLSAEQLWDSLVALSVPSPEENRRRILEDYREIMNTSWANVDLDEAMRIKGRFDNLGKNNMMVMDRRRRNNNGGEMLAMRASELPLPAPVGSFLYTFGQSDKRFIENANKEGSIPQVMLMLNGNLTNKIMAAESRALVQRTKEAHDQDDGIDICFLSILSRRPSSMDRDYAEKIVRGGDGTNADYSDLIWALLNLREFMFIQ